LPGIVWTQFGSLPAGAFGPNQTWESNTCTADSPEGRSAAALLLDYQPM
jgi:hypothetical protein